MAKIGWVKIHRKIQECSIWDSDEPFDRRSAWIDLLLLANHEDKKTIFDGEVVTVKRGQRITSVRLLADRWHWGTKKTLNFLKLLEAENMIVRESNSRRTLLTIVNYEVYQVVDTGDATLTATLTQQSRNTDDNTHATLTAHKQEYIKNDKNEKNDKNDKEINIKGAALPNPFEQVKQERLKAAGEIARKAQNGSLDELEDQMSRSSASDELKDELRKWWHFRREEIKKPMKSQGIRNTVADASQSEVLYGTELTIACFEKSIRNGYQGVFFNEKDMKATVKELKEQGATFTVGKGGQPKIDWSSL